MNKKTTISIKKETELGNLLNLKKAIYSNTFEEITTDHGEWGGTYVIITSSEEKIIKAHNQEPNWSFDPSDDTYVLTKHSKILTSLFYYVKENIMNGKDFYLYGFMALLANDFIKEFGDLDDYTPLLEYIVSGISFYCINCGKTDLFDLMKFFLSENISDEEINKIGVYAQ